MAEKVIIIAEAGVNHNGDLTRAKELIDAAAEAQVDYVKFQTFIADKIVTKTAKRAKYQDQNTGDGDSQYEMLKKLELSHENHQELKSYATKRGVKFLSTAFDLESLDYLKEIGIDLAKIPSGEITNYPYLKKLAGLFPKIVMSTGMANMQEIKDAFRVLINNGAKQENISILHCNTEYPTPMIDVNLKAMKHIQDELGVSVGYSDHTLGIEVPIAAVALGAVLIEKHFTLDRNLPGPDHKASLEPLELKAMVTAIRNIEKAIGGSGKKEPSASELKNKEIVRKSIVASRAIAKGEVFREENITIKRPGTGLSPMLYEKVIGTPAIRNFDVDQLISLK